MLVRYSLIIAEDENESRHGLMDYFPWNDLGFAVKGGFASGEGALSYLKEGGDADVLLTDIMMPGMNGMDLIEKARSIRPEMIPVVLTGYSDFSYARRCISLGVREYILKPAGYDELKDVFTRIRRELDSKGDSRKRLSPSECTEMMRKYISEHLDTASLKELSDKFSLNQYYISELFHNHTGIGFQEYTQNERMKEAQRLLSSTHLGISAISSKVGYTSPSSFTRSFREKFGMSPKEFRERQYGG